MSAHNGESTLVVGVVVSSVCEPMYIIQVASTSTCWCGVCTAVQSNCL